MSDAAGAGWDFMEYRRTVDAQAQKWMDDAEAKFNAEIRGEQDKWHRRANEMAGKFEERGAEIRRLRDAIGALAESWRDGCDIDGGDFQEVMVKYGLLVSVPADESFRAEFDADEMYVLAWSPLAEIAKEE